ncbi:hypothetical protein BHM03_00005857 [Ensete ventricosum]|nr:hypothetical protein BHM03_00005857 [Ensete ventricosum]
MSCERPPVNPSNKCSSKESLPLNHSTFTKGATTILPTCGCINFGADTNMVLTLFNDPSLSSLGVNSSHLLVLVVVMTLASPSLSASTSSYSPRVNANQDSRGERGSKSITLN